MGISPGSRLNEHCRHAREEKLLQSLFAYLKIEYAILRFLMFPRALACAG